MAYKEFTTFPRKFDHGKDRIRSDVIWLDQA